MNRLPQPRTITALAVAALMAATPLSAATTNVTYGYYFFNPKVVTIHEGDTIQWTGTGFHTLLGTGADPICGGASLPCSYTFNTVGSYAYECTVPGHAALGMTGMVVVASAVIQPPPVPGILTNVVHLPNGAFQFTVLTATNQTNIIQASTDLAATNWVSLATNVPSGTNAFIFTDTNAPRLSLRFYRVASPK